MVSEITFVSNSKCAMPDALTSYAFGTLAFHVDTPVAHLSNDSS